MCKCIGPPRVALLLPVVPGEPSTPTEEEDDVESPSTSADEAPASVKRKRTRRSKRGGGYRVRGGKRKQHQELVAAAIAL